MRNNSILIAPIIAIIFLAGCQTREETNGGSADSVSATLETAVADSSSSDVQQFTGQGTVENITPSRTYIIIKHGPIEGYMDAMTMPFEVRNEQLLNEVAIGDSVRFELSTDGTQTWVSDLGKM
jgi:protein SCO1